jgi:riboflavin synthase
MFTGIVEALGRVESLDGARLVIDAAAVAGDAAVGDSISVNGVCLTVAQRADASLAFDLADETLRRTSIGGLVAGDPVNLERPVTLATRLGGHVVQGHVDGVGTVRDVTPAGEGREVTIALPDGLGRYLVEKGSVAVDGVSLTVAGVEDAAFRVALIPHTLTATTLGSRRAGDAVNLEVDVLAKYVERLTKHG